VEAGARILADTRVDGFLLEGDRVVGLRGRMHDPDTGEAGGSVTVRAREVIVCAGGIGTPRLLHHAGIAEKLGPAVGEGLHIHPGNAVLAFAEEPVEMWRGATQGAYFHVPEDPGILPHTFSAPPEVCLGTMRAVGPETKEALARLDRLCGLVVMISDKGHGRVRAFSDGRADITYDFDPNDMERIRLGMRWAARVLLAGGAKEFFAPVHGTGRYTDADSLYEALAGKTPRDYTMYAAHPMSTCRMGRDPSTSVIQPDGRAHGLKGLSLMDSSIFPTSLGVNPSLTTMAMATVLARGLAQAG
jgi:choline dehydrogenase-like flavoprotein